MEIMYFKNQQGFDCITLDEAVIYYKYNRSDFLIEAILYKLKGSINTYLYKVDSRDREDLLERIETKIFLGIEQFDASKNIKFKTYIDIIIKNSYYEFLRLRKEQALSLNVTSNDSEEGTEIINTIEDSSTEMYDSETNLFLDGIKNDLTETEYNVCKVLVSESHKMTIKEVALEIGLTISGIAHVYKRLQQYFIRKGIYTK